MSLPYFSNSLANKLTNYAPIYKSLFEVVINSPDITKEDSNYLIEIIKKIDNNILYFNVLDNLKTIEILLKMKNKFNMFIKLFSPTGDVIGLFYLEDCIFESKYELKLLNFSWDSDDILDYEIEFDYNKIKFYTLNTINNYENFMKNYERKKKLKKIFQ